MRLNAEHQDRARGFFIVALVVILAASGAACSKTWVLGGPVGAGGMAGSGSAGGVGGTDAPGGTGGTSGFGGRGDQGAGGRTCSPTMSLAYNIPSAEMLFVVGRNLSMMTKFGDTNRMTAVQMDVHNIVASNQATIDFGYQSFPSFTGCSNGGTCCPSSDDPVAPSPFAMSAIDDMLYQPCDSNGAGMGCVASTDSRAVSSTLYSIASLFNSNDRYAVLVTDGPPGCPTDDPTKTCSNAMSAVNALTHAGIKVYVVGVGDGASDDSCLGQLATQGNTGMTVFAASDPNSLMKALSQIVNVAAVTCTVELKVPLSPEQLGLVALVVQNKEIHYDQMGNNGWSYNISGSTVRLELHGTSCLFLQNAHSPQVNVWFGCPPCTVPSSTCL